MFLGGEEGCCVESGDIWYGFLEEGRFEVDRMGGFLKVVGGSSGVGVFLWGVFVGFFMVGRGRVELDVRFRMYFLEYL